MTSFSSKSFCRERQRNLQTRKILPRTSFLNFCRRVLLLNNLGRSKEFSQGRPCFPCRENKTCGGPDQFPFARDCHSSPPGFQNIGRRIPLLYRVFYDARYADLLEIFFLEVFLEALINFFFSLFV